MSQDNQFHEERSLKVAFWWAIGLTCLLSGPIFFRVAGLVGCIYILVRMAVMAKKEPKFMVLAFILLGWLPMLGLYAGVPNLLKTLDIIHVAVDPDGGASGNGDSN